MFQEESIKSNDVLESNYDDGIWSTANSVSFDFYLNNSQLFCNGTNYNHCFNRSDFNYTKLGNETEAFDRSFDLLMGITSVVLGLMILITVIGKVLIRRRYDSVILNISVNPGDWGLIPWPNVLQHRTVSGNGILVGLDTMVTLCIVQVSMLAFDLQPEKKSNVFVIAAILLERNLQNVANYLIVSLAVADLMVACLVMPLGAVYEIMKGWVLGPELCDMWTSCDVLCCTASILHLVAIAIDRYWAVTDVDYIHTRNVNKIGVMIIVVWTVALIVSLAPQFGWKDPGYLERINSQKRCLVSQDVAYQVFATCSTFYVPLLVILILYWKIFQTARKRIRKNRKSKISSNTASVTSSENQKSPRNFLRKKRLKSFKRNSKQNSATKALVSSLNIMEGHSTMTVDAVLPDDITESQKSSDTVTDTSKNEEKAEEKKCQQFGTEVTTAFTISKNGEMEKVTPPNNASPEKSSEGITNNGSASHQSHISELSRIEILQPDTGGVTKYGTAAAIVKAVNPMQLHKEKKESLEAKRERKAAKTLAIITGAFVICWLPFFIMALLMPLFGPISDHLASFFLWLGYFNSTLNPVIYTIFSPEFRQAFKRILFGAPRRNPHYRPGKWR